MFSQRPRQDLNEDFLGPVLDICQNVVAVADFVEVALDQSRHFTTTSMIFPFPFFLFPRWSLLAQAACEDNHVVNAPADLDSYGIAFVSFRDNLDLSTPSGRLMF